ncbi:MAG: hypothetical protein AAGB26_03250 [Planctomycetota bacterium]
MNKADRRFSSTHAVRFALLIAVALLASGCQDIRTLREAQEVFNKGATLDNAHLHGQIASRYSSGELDRGPFPPSPKLYYAETLEILAEIDDEAITQDGLMGSKLVLQALAQWKMGEYEPDQYEEALKSRTQALEYVKEIDTRDRIMMLALPGLVRADEMHDLATGEELPKMSDINDLASTGSNGAVKPFSDAILAAKKQPIEIYLRRGILAFHANHVQALGRFIDPPHPDYQGDKKLELIQSAKAVKDNAQTQITELLKAMRAMQESLSLREALFEVERNFWAMKFGIEPGNIPIPQ